ncbi:Hypothetical protein RMHFA_02220 [Roseomonas mucosa]|uniref:Uncharacterized protein n=1 Tax=Roseomonas mucosa TaxID=207340 RepID=A0A379N2Z0_9PROT|nr:MULTISPECIES: hypothetical protein [Roseomonas]MBS5901337.1 hypothetical protein [Acetobacteraceae bacterium]ATR20275.1 hypothetical protein CTJ15_08160 [Roseomonas sp. FDAARGOS_362]AWV23001.1 Hypothetical protein RADP37_02220 [Roseomonas mucosa]MCG7350207.1 hypothetical protein [Roseomonas mucosa]MCG7357261.1 hypothetical protein [Roseomonas mucosa]
MSSSNKPAPAAHPCIFSDGIIDAQVRHGVARFTLGQTGTDGQLAPAGQLVLPLTQLPNLIGSITRLLQELEARARQAQQQQGTAAAAEPAPPAGGAFRFSTD